MRLYSLHSGVSLLHNSVRRKVGLRHHSVLVEVADLRRSDLARRLNVRCALLRVAARDDASKAVLHRHVLRQGLLSCRRIHESLVHGELSGLRRLSIKRVSYLGCRDEQAFAESMRR